MQADLKHPWQPLPEAALRQRQVEKLRAYLRDTVLPFSAHYKKAWHGFDPRDLRTLDDLQHLPFTTKEDLAAGPGAVREFVLEPDPAVLARRPRTIIRALFQGKKRVKEGFEREFRPLLMTSTTGRSAEAVPFFYTDHDIAVLRAAGAKVMRICGAERDWRLINMFPFAPHLAFWITHYAGTEFGVFVLGTGGGKSMGTDGNLRLLKRIQPNALIGMPTFLYHVLSAAVAEGVHAPQLKKIVLGGEKVPVGMRRKLRNLAGELGAPLVDVLCTYGFTEAKMAWAECPYPHDRASGGYHIPPELGIIEIVDPVSGAPVGLGEPGEIVFTPLEARGSVVLRYRTGDVIDGGLVYEACPHCGRVLPRLVGDISRKSEVREMRLEKLKGTLVDFNALEHVLDDCEWVGAWQLELRKRDNDPLQLDELILHVALLDGEEGRMSEERARRELATLFAAKTEVSPNAVLFHSNEEMRQLQGVGRELKEMRLVDHRPVNHHPAPIIHGGQTS